MKVNNLKVSVMVGFVGLTSFLVTSCTDDDTPNTPSATTDGISFSVNDVQAVKNEPSLQMTKAPQVYETQTTPLLGRDAEGLQLVETTVEGVNPIYYPAESRGIITTKDNFATINKPFTIFACKNGSTTANYLYGQEVNADGTMKNAVKWRKSEAAGLKFYAVHPAPTASNITTTSGQNPIIKFSPDADAKKQTDLLVAATDNYNYDDYVNTKIPITFNHATTAIFFKVGNDLSYNRKVTKIEILNVIGEGTYDIAQKKWTLGTTKKSYALTLAQPFSTAVQPGATMNGGDGIFFMIPQTLPTDAQVKISFESGDPVIAKIGGKDKNGHDKVWAEGTTKTYTISNSKAVDDREYIFTVTPNAINKEYNETDVPFTVQSYRHLKEAPTSRDKGVAWTIKKYEYSEDGSHWTEGRPSMVASINDHGEGGTSGQVCNLTLTNEYKDYKALREAELKAAQEVTTRKDLSIDANGIKNTANCYIVSTGGKYKFPLVYGNAIKNGATNNDAFKPNVVNSNAIKCFVGGAGDITKPEIENAENAELLWCSEPNLVTVEGISGGFVEFSVDKTKMKEASAVITVKTGVSAGETVLWSWHIWITSKDVANTNSGYFMLEPLGFRHTIWGGTTYQTDRKVRITFEQAVSGKTAQITITQKPKELENVGVSMFYQQGRKDPLWWQSPFRCQTPGNDKGFTLRQASMFPERMAAARNISNHSSSKGNWDWTFDAGKDNTFFNLWDAKNTTGYGYNGTFIKTVYDPSPAGFHVPRASDFSKITDGNNGKPATVTKIGYLAPDYWSNGIVQYNRGYFWSTEKRVGDIGSKYGYYGVHALSRRPETNFFGVKDTGASDTFISNCSYGFSVISVKE